jgi:hypothetical protein
VWDENALLLPGECKLGRYHVAILRRSSSGWVPTTPPVNVLVTNYRLLLHPQTRRQYKPAVIPSSFVTHVGKAEMGYHRGVRIELKNGMRLYMTINWSESEELTDTVKKMLTSPIGNTFIPHPPQEDLNRLIEFISHM